MLISDIMTKCVAECTEDLGLSEVYELIQKCDHGLVVVVDSNVHRVPIGVINEGSICAQVITRDRHPRSLSAGSVMVSTIKTVTADDLVEDVRTEDLDSITAIVVTGSNRQVCGVISPQKLSSMKRASRAPETVFVQEKNDRRPRRVSEIPAFGWV